MHSAGRFYTEVEGFTPETALLTIIAAISQSFMMGFFFLIAAYFIPSSLGKKGSGRFVHDRLVRLGVPLLAWVLFIGPCSDIAVTLQRRRRDFQDPWKTGIRWG